MATPTVRQAKTFDSSPLLSQADEWDTAGSLADDHRRAMSDGVGRSADYWRSAGGDALRAGHTVVDQLLTRATHMLSSGAAAARSGQEAISHAQVIARQAIANAEAAGYRVDDDGMVRPSTAQIALAAGLRDPRSGVAMAALRRGANDLTENVQSALAAFGDSIDTAGKNIHEAFRSPPDTTGLHTDAPTNATLPLYGSDGKPHSSDVDQGSLGDCYFEAAESSVADSSPQRIQDMIKPDGQGGYTVSMWDKSGEKCDDIPVSQQDINDAMKNHTGQQVLWPVVLQAAAAKIEPMPTAQTMGTVSDGLGSMGKGDLPGVGLQQLTGQSHTTMDPNLGSDMNGVMADLNAGKPVVMATNYSATPIGWDPHRDGLVDGHVYQVMNMHRDPDGTVWAEVNNPWGFNESHGTSGDHIAPADPGEPGSKWVNVSQATADGGIAAFASGAK